MKSKSQMLKNVQKYAKYRHYVIFLDYKSKMLNMHSRPDLPAARRSGVKYAFLHINVQCQKIQFPQGVSM